MSKPKPVTMLVCYYPKRGKERAFLTLLKQQWPVLRRARLASATPAQIWRATDKKTKRRFFVEVFQWKDEKASDHAHRTPEVMAIWDPMMPLLEDMQLTRLEQKV